MKTNRMLKFFKYTTFLGIALLTSACATKEIAFIDTVKILQESDHGKAAIIRMESFQNAAIKNLETMEKSRNAAEKSKKSKLAERITMEMQAYAYDLQTKLQAEQELVFTKISEELSTVVDDYRAKNNLTVILNLTEMISYDKSADVTQEIMDIFNKLPITFGELPAIIPPTKSE